MHEALCILYGAAAEGQKGLLGAVAGATGEGKAQLGTKHGEGRRVGEREGYY